MASVAVVVFTRDLRVDDHPALARAAREADHVVPLFVLRRRDPRRQRSTGPTGPGSCWSRSHDLDDALRALGGALVVRRGDWVRRGRSRRRAHVGADVGARQRRRERVRTRATRSPRRPRSSVAGRACAGGHGRRRRAHITPGDRRVTTTRCSRRTSGAGRRCAGVTSSRRPSAVVAARRRRSGSRCPTLADLVEGDRVARRRSRAVRVPGTHGSRRGSTSGLRGYADHHDDLPGDATSRLSPYLHFGCLSPLEALRAAAHHQGEGPDAFVRQLCWRDFYAQILAARPDAAWSDYVGPRRPLARRSRGRAGVEGGPHRLPGRRRGDAPAAGRRASCTTAPAWWWRRSSPRTSPSTGASGRRHFLDLLVDGDLANNNLNWQWVAGTGTDTNPHRVFNPTVQGQRFDPDGDYVRRYVPELRAVEGRHRPRPRPQGPPRRTTTPTPSSTTARPSPSTRTATPAPDSRGCVTAVNSCALCPQLDAGWRPGQPSAMVPTNWVSWRRLRHS